MNITDLIVARQLVADRQRELHRIAGHSRLRREAVRQRARQRRRR